MAILYTYPVKTTPANNDLILISDSADDNKTKQVKVSSLPGGSSSGVTQIIAGTNVTIDPVGGTGSVTINSSGGSTSPASPSNSVQFNNAGAFGGSELFIYTNRVLSLGAVGDTARSHLKIYGGDDGGGNDQDAYLTLYCSAGTHGVTIEGPDHTGGSNYTLKLPASLPSVANQILESNASGTLSWIATPTSGASYLAGDGLDLTGNTFSTDLKANSGLVIDTTELALNLSASAIAGTLAVGNGGTGISTYAQGDLLYAETTSTLATVNTSSGNKFLGTATASPYYPEWKTNLVPEEVNTGNLLIGGATSTSEMTLLDTTTKGTIAVGSGSTTTTKAVGTDNYVLTARSADATGVDWLQMSTAKMSDYEIGSWTPTAYASTGAAPSTGTCVGYYERIGEIVIVHFYLPITSSSASNVTMMIGGLPYTGVTGNGYLGGVSLYANNGTNYLQQQAVSGMVNGAYINLYRFTNTGSSTDFNYIAASWYAPASLTYTIAGSATYRKA